MYAATLTTALFALAGTVSSRPSSCGRTFNTRNGNGTAADTVLAIMPQSVSCEGRGDECATADGAAPYLAGSMSQYRVTSSAEQAGILALIAYESIELQYRTNQNAEQKALGRGTANEYVCPFHALLPCHILWSSAFFPSWDCNGY